MIYKSETKSDSLKQLLAQLKSSPELFNESKSIQCLEEGISRVLSDLMLIPVESLDTHASFSSMGVDSLVSIEIRNWWRGTLGSNISVLEITNAGNISRLAAIAMISLKEKHGTEETKAIVQHKTVDGAKADQNLVSELLYYQDEFSPYAERLKLIENYAFPPPAGKAVVFLTGATGNLGSEILRRLLHTDGIATVIALVRANSPQHEWGRIKRAAKIAGWWEESTYNAKIEVWPGDLSQKRLGLDKEHFARLQGESTSPDQTPITAIIHNGAVVNFNTEYDALRATNVESTAQLFKSALSSAKQVPRFLYTSGGVKIDNNRPFEDIAPTLSTYMGHSQTKTICDRFIQTATSYMPPQQNLISIIKPGFIIGSTESGVTNIADVMADLIAAAGALKLIPIMPDDRWLWISGVDEIADKVLSQLTSNSDAFEAFLDVNDGMMMSKFWAIISEELGLSQKSEPWDLWAQHVRQDFPSLGRRIQTFHRVYENHEKYLPTERPVRGEEKSRTQVALRSTVKYLKNIGFIEASSQESKEMSEEVIKRQDK